MVMLIRCPEHRRAFARLRRRRTAARAVMAGGAGVCLGAAAGFIFAEMGLAVLLTVQALGAVLIIGGDRVWWRYWLAHQRNDGASLNCHRCF